MTAREMVRRSLMLIGVLSEGETASADQLQDGLDTLRDMLGSWSTEGVTVPSRVREEFTLTTGQSSFSIGTGGNFDTVRPVEIERATVKDETSTPATETPIDIINQDQWVAITAKSLAGTPRKLYSAGTTPLDTLYVWPVTDQARKLVLYSRKLLISIVSADTELDLPEGYSRAIRFNLAVEQAAEYGKPVPGEVASIAAESKANIMRLNSKPQYLKVEHQMFVDRRFNILTGE